MRGLPCQMSADLKKLLLNEIDDEDDLHRDIIYSRAGKAIEAPH